MTERQLNELAGELSCLCVFRDVLDSKPFEKLLEFLKNKGDDAEKMSLYGEFVFSLAEYDYDFSNFLRRAVFENENAYIINKAKNKTSSKTLSDNTVAELSLFSKLSRLTPQSLCDNIVYDGYIPKFDSEEIDFESEYHNRIKNINRYGYGIFSSAKMFKLNDGIILPVESADEISADDFIGYEEQRKKVFDNTKALIEGRPAANVLLFGDAGTGKSSTVKACANYFYEDGVRLIELRKDQLFSLSYIMGKISENPLKFIIFIDDLSFNKNDDCFSMLKAALEGSASAKAKNAVIYATSNRRHIVKENFSGRGISDDIHHSDTVQELMSLSDRFGLTVYYSRPDKALYLDIVHRLAQKAKLKIEQSELDIKAEAFALAKGSRSPRAAEQFINNLSQKEN